MHTNSYYSIYILTVLLNVVVIFLRNYDVFKQFYKLKGPYADHILIPQGSTGSSTFFDFK